MLEWLADKDFANYWIASRLLLSGQVLDLFGDHASYFRHLVAEFGPDYPWRNWSYPPHYLLAIWPLGLFNYVVAMAGFLVLTLLAYLWAVRAFVGRLETGAVAAAVLLPAIIDNLQHAQNGFLTGALLLGGLALRYRRPVLAGILIGCLTIKPQLGVLLPFLLLFERRWLVVLGAGLTTVALVLLSALLFGWESWQGYLTQSAPYQSRVMTEGTGVFLWMMPSVFGVLRVLQVDPGVALAVHGAVAAAVLGAAGMALWRCQDAGQRAAIVIMTTMVITPYWLSYDFAAAAAALLLMYGRHSGPSPRETRIRRLLMLAAFAPIIAIPFWLLHVPMASALVLLGFALVLLHAPRTISPAEDHDAGPAADPVPTVQGGA